MTRIPALAIVASDVEGKPCWIQHLGLVISPTELKNGDTVEVCHMGPPLQLGLLDHPRRGPEGRMLANCVAWIDLRQDQSDAMRDWLADLKTRIPARRCHPISQYTISPAYVETRDQVTGVKINEQMSCVGLVLECYRAANVALMAGDYSGHIPLVGIKAISRIFGAQMGTHLKDYQAMMNLRPPDGPWPVIFGGYVLHGVAKGTIPHQPRIKEVVFA